MKINFASKINSLHTASTNAWFFMAINPVFLTHKELLNCIEEANTISAEDEKTERLNAFIGCALTFDPAEIKKHLESTIEEFQATMMNDQWKWFSESNIPFAKDLESYKFSNTEILRCKSVLANLYAPVYQMLNELERSQKHIDAKLTKLNDTTRSLTSGLVGGKLGAVVGSMILPGIGTVVGAAIGGMMTENAQQDSIYDSIYEDIQKCFEICDRIKYYFIKNSKFIYSTLHDLTKLEVDRDKRAFLGVKDKFPEAVEVFDRYYCDQVEQVEKVFNDVPEDSELSLKQHLDEMFEYIKWELENAEAA